MVQDRSERDHRRELSQLKSTKNVSINPPEKKRVNQMGRWTKRASTPDNAMAIKIHKYRADWIDEGNRKTPETSGMDHLPSDFVLLHLEAQIISGTGSLLFFRSFFYAFKNVKKN